MFLSSVKFDLKEFNPATLTVDLSSLLVDGDPVNVEANFALVVQMQKQSRLALLKWAGGL